MRRRDLVQAGLGRAEIDRRLADGGMRRVRRGIYASAALSSEACSAVALGGRLACVSLLRDVGIWVTRSHPLHIQMDPASSPTTDRRGVECHWVPTAAGPRDARVPVAEALRTAARCQPRSDAVASIDSALRLGMVRRSELEALGSSRVSALLDVCDPRADSGLESLVRLALHDLGVRAEPQVLVAGVGRVDLLVEGCVVVETDGAAFHAGARRHVDHVRDAAASATGLTPLRFDAHQVIGDIDGVVGAVLGAIARHRGIRNGGVLARNARDRDARGQNSAVAARPARLGSTRAGRRA